MARFIDPFEEMDRMLAAAANRNRAGVMPLDAYEQDGVYTLRFDLPGVDPEKIDVTVEDKVLTVKAERLFEDTVGANWMLRERPTGTHSRQVRLGDSLDASKVDATYNEGVLTVTLPVREEAMPHKIEVTSHKAEALEASAS
ncbi:MAG: Hsp20/alpha crystallin family protein [Actinomycetia bacterium]|nr:Hsp20/alpha crystallin family protein [Actinomycetes bacterium]